MHLTASNRRCSVVADSPARVPCSPCAPLASRSRASMQSLPRPPSTSARARLTPDIHGSPPPAAGLPAATAHRCQPPTGPSFSSFPAVPFLARAPHAPRRVVVPSWFPYRPPICATASAGVGIPLFDNSEPIRNHPPERSAQQPQITPSQPSGPPHSSSQVSPSTRGAGGLQSARKLRDSTSENEPAEAGTPTLATPVEQPARLFREVPRSPVRTASGSLQVSE